jgi:hypothetical protein
MRDRSRARNYSASRDEFRRAHERHRAWGLQRRHSERMRQIREREAGCWPADLEALRGGVEDGQSGIADELTPGTARLLMRRDTRGRACDPPARSTEPARSVRQAGPARKAPPRAGERTAVKSCSPPSNHGRRQALALSREQAPGRDHAPAEDRVDVAAPPPPARPPRPGRAGEHQSRPTRSMVTRRARKLAADEQQSHGQNTRQKATLTLPGNVLNPHRAPPQHGRRIPPTIRARSVLIGKYCALGFRSAVSGSVVCARRGSRYGSQASVCRSVTISAAVELCATEIGSRRAQGAVTR